ncbi:unnamed protein product [Spirodela intermedia]|uniref:Uncharacterized protein n=1 Tax=Spirodela intermedia TaxID=51605 RepID=A0A7I8JX29_SPIIN|nr:unnamed protein product [Spirodela intermedia]
MMSKIWSAACMMVLLLTTAFPREAEANADEVAFAQIKWPKWFWCFPECVFGETCFFHVYDMCFDVDPKAGWVICMLVALDWCDINHIHNNSSQCIRLCDPPPPVC